MRQAGNDLYDWKINAESDEVVSSSKSMESQLFERSSAMQTEYSLSSRESSLYSDERSTPSPDSSNEARDLETTSVDEKRAHFLRLRLNETFVRRKTSSCSETSSIDSASLSLDGASDTERNSPTYHNDDNGPQVGINKYDDIIDKIFGLRFSQSNYNTKSNETHGLSSRNDGTIGRSIDDITNENDEDKIDDDRESVKVLDEDDVNGNYENDRKNDDNEYWNDARTQNDDVDNYEEGEDDEDGDEEDEDEDLVERGPVRPPGNHQSRHSKPYYTLDWLAATSDNVSQNQSYTSDYDSTAEQILRNKQFSEKINPCLDKLSDYGQRDRSYFNIAEHLAYGNLNANSGSPSPEANNTEITPGSSTSGEDAINAQIPSIVLNDPAEASLLEILASGGFQAAHTLSDTASIQNPSPGTASSENWPDSPASSYNVLSSRSHSRASSRAQSPGSGANVGSPLLHLNIVASPADSQHNSNNFRGQALSSSESSNHSYGDTPSPSNYQTGIDQRVEEQLGLDFGSFSTWCQSCMSSGTVVNSTETIDAIDNNELQLVEEVIRRDQCEKRNKMEEMQVVPKSESFAERYDGNEVASLRRISDTDLVPNVSTIRRNYVQSSNIENVFDDRSMNKRDRSKTKNTDERSCLTAANVANQNNHHQQNQQQVYTGVNVSQLGNTGSLISSAQNNLVYPDLDDVYNLTYSDDMQSSNVYNENPLNSTESLMDFENSMENFLVSHYNVATTMSSSTSSLNTTCAVVLTPSTINDFTQISGSHNSSFDNTWRGQEVPTPKSTFNDFQIPETVSSYRQNRPRRTSERSIAPWPSLNLPLTAASERLKSGLDPEEVERAMKNLLKKPTKELAAGDEDGDTMLMCLVGNHSELEKKKAYLVPLVERLGSVSGALTMTNNRGEDALYLAAINCPQMAYVTGYLAAALLQKGIDVSQRLYHTRGDTLIHAVAAKGETHGEVMAELLALKTPQGNSVFDLSKRNYDGRTPLHVAVESHDPTGSGINCIGTTRLLLENGADTKMKETKCGDTALHMAVTLCCDPALVKALLWKNGYEAVNITNYNNNTPVHMAAALSKTVPIDRQIEVCATLIRAGGLTNIQNRQGKTPLALVSADRKDSIKQIFHKKT